MTKLIFIVGSRSLVTPATIYMFNDKIVRRLDRRSPASSRVLLPEAKTDLHFINLHFGNHCKHPVAVLSELTVDARFSIDFSRLPFPRF